MKKYILKNSGKEFKIGDTVDVTVTVNTPFGIAKCVQKVVVDEKTLELLMKEGLVKVQEDEVKPLLRMIARKLGLSLTEAEIVVSSFKDLSPYAALQLMLVQAADKLNQGKTFDKVWFSISPRGSVMRLSTPRYKGVLAFATEEDALKAINMVGDFYKSVYGE